MAVYRTALVLGRFQPFHKGHLYLLHTALSMADTVVIALGSSNVIDEKNPLSYETRREMMLEVLRHENMEQRVTAIVPSPDDPSDEVWLQKLLENTGPFEIALGNNEWVNNVLISAGYRAVTLPDLERNIYQGMFIRQAFYENAEWKSRVPEYLHSLVEKELQGRA